MKKFRVIKPVDYVVGHLRSGYLSGEFEANSIEEIKEMFSDDDFSSLDFVADDYEVDELEVEDTPMIIEEIKE